MPGALLKFNYMYTLKILLLGFFLGKGMSDGKTVPSGSGMDNGLQTDTMVQGHRYHTLDTTGFYLYSLNKLVQGEKIARPQTVYYFSVKPGEPILELTMENLEKAFAANTRFRYQLEAQFRSDKDLMAYDPVLKTYKIKYIYRQYSN